MFERSKTTEAICAALRGCNREITWAALEQVAGKPVDEIRQTVIHARRYLERDEGIVFVTVRGVGLRRLTDAEKIASSAGFSRKIHRTAGRGAMRIGAVSDMASLPNEDQLAATLRLAVFNAVQRETNMDAK